MAALGAATIARVAIATLGLTVASTAFGLQADQTQKASPTTSAAAAAAPPAGTADVAKGRELFANWGCNSCHVLGDAGADGHIGPALDGNPALTRAFVVDRVTNGQGQMPAFGGQMSDEEIATISTYIVQVAKK